MSSRSVALAAGGLGLVATWVSASGAPAEAMHAYLFAFIYWLSFPLGALFLLSIFHSTSARWPVVFRRPLEWLSQAMIIFVPLFIPIAVGGEHVFRWLRPGEALEHQAPYLNRPAFIARAALYFLVWCAIAWQFRRWSAQQDAAPQERLIRLQRWLGAGGLPLLGVTVSFAALDWVMSIDPGWVSTIFGVYLFSGAVVVVLSTIAVMGSWVQPPGSFGAAMQAGHFQRLGTLLLSFVVFWAYCAYSQAMLMWIADLPREAGWYLSRARGPWAAIVWVLGFGHFVVPFAALLIRAVKQSRAAQATIGALLISMHALDMYWLVMPGLHPAGPRWHWSVSTAVVGVGGLFVASVLWAARGQNPLPVGEPALGDSLRVEVP